MLQNHDVIAPGALLVGFALAGLALWRLIAWIRHAPTTPDPWDEETGRRLRQPDAHSLCHRCFTPASPVGWFCEYCGSAVGPYNNLIPYVRVFSEGEVFRNGVADRLRASPLIVAGYFLYSQISYVVFAPVYWFFLFKNLKRCSGDNHQGASLEAGGA